MPGASTKTAPGRNLSGHRKTRMSSTEIQNTGIVLQNCTGGGIRNFPNRIRSGETGSVTGEIIRTDLFEFVGIIHCKRSYAQIQDGKKILPFKMPGQYL